MRTEDLFARQTTEHLEREGATSTAVPFCRIIEKDKESGSNVSRSAIKVCNSAYNYITYQL